MIINAVFNEVNHTLHANLEDFTGYEVGKTEGYNDGYSKGFAEGSESAERYDEGYKKGQEEGYKEGYKEGYTEGDFSGYQSGYENGFREGTWEGIEQGKQEGQLSVWNASESLQGNVSGVAISVNDVSPIKHNVGCTVGSKNLLNFSIEYLFDSSINKSYYENGTLYVEVGSGNSLGVLSNKIYLPTNIPLYYKHKITDTNGDRVVIRCYDENNNNISANISIGWGSYLAYYEGFFGTGAKGFNFTLPSQVSYIVLAYCRMKGSTDATFYEYSELQIDTTATEYTPYISNFEGVEVTCCGKNICKELSTENTPSLVYRRIIFDYFPKGEYTIFSPDTPIHFYAFQGCQASTYKKDSNGVQYGVCFNVLTGGSISIGFRKTDETLWVDGTKVMLVQGNIEYPQFNSLYEDYKGQTVKVGDNGIVDGIKSISPNMTLLSNNGAVSINAKYYKDPDIVISNLQQAVALTGGE